MKTLVFTVRCGQCQTVHIISADDEPKQCVCGLPLDESGSTISHSYQEAS